MSVARGGDAPRRQVLEHDLRAHARVFLELREREVSPIAVARVVLVDAVDAPFPPGTVVRMTPDELAGGGAPAWSLHDLNLADTLGMMRLRETLPEMILLGVVPADIETYSLELSEPLAARFGEIVEKVRSEIAAFAASPRP